MQTAQEWIQQLELIAHPEGGYYRETLRDSHVNRAPYSSIYFLLTHEEISHFHRIDADEVWYHHAGETLTIHMIMPDGVYRTARLGRNISDGDVLQYCVPKGTIFASSLDDNEGYSLVGCMCQPAFEFEHFELFERNQLLEQYPNLENIINKYAIKHK
ncbi:cupin domain-containing protein [Staphylococcus caprae]|uniref:cupin domain-containing protein n=1 Tax=Staphylococcus caprae TaxID=29380 RepID=UPI001C83C4A7|nr:cupin domain-containing protein [Staphylococcus caprae]MBX5319060.1 cupin domain-containing protein [Staphylococcus caprae]MDI9231353.1 cupin domain-containing protein [Staphylococcus caprae]